MAYKCELCGKGAMRGNLVSHSKRRTKRLFKPNLHFTRLLVLGKLKRVRVCMDCLKKGKKAVEKFRLRVIPKKSEAKVEVVEVIEEKQKPEKKRKARTSEKSENLKLVEEIISGENKKN